MGSPRAVLIFKTTHTYLRSGEISDNDKKKNSKVLQKEKKNQRNESQWKPEVKRQVSSTL